MSPNFDANARVSLTLTPGKLEQLETAMDNIEEHVGKVADVWPRASNETKRAVLERSPILSRFIALAERVVR